jgi:hypothetical protein
MALTLDSMDWADGTLSLGGERVGEVNQRCVSKVMSARI